MRGSERAKQLSRNIKKQKKNIPTVFTLINLALGFTAIIEIFYARYDIASLLILLGFIFDMLDGMAARKLQVTSEQGIELDSLADSITFVIAPALLVFFNFFQTTRIGIVVSIFIVICGILRLAKFNVMKTKDYFVGMPTPFFAAIVVSFVFLNIALKERVAAILFFILSYLMVSHIKYPSFKDKRMRVYKYIGITLMSLMAIAFIAKVNVTYIAIGVNILVWAALVIPLFFNKAVKKKKYQFVFALGLLLATIGFYKDPQFLIVLPVVYSVAAAPLLITAFKGRKLK